MITSLENQRDHEDERGPSHKQATAQGSNNHILWTTDEDAAGSWHPGIARYAEVTQNVTKR